MATVLVSWMACEPLGFLLQFIIGDYLAYFPIVPINQEFFNSVTERRHMVIGLLLLACASIDYLTYVNYPLQKRFIIAKTERSYSEN